MQMWLSKWYCPKKLPGEGFSYYNKVYIGNDRNRKCPKRWEAFYNCLKEKDLLDEMKAYLGLERITFLKQKILKGFTKNKKFPFARIVCKSHQMFYIGRGLFENKHYDKYTNECITSPKTLTIEDCVDNFQFDLYESKMNPMVRCIHHLKIKPCGWVKIDNYRQCRVEKSLCDIDIVTDWKNVKTIKKNDISKMILGFYDIECNSSHGDFPQAQKNYQSLVREIRSEYTKLYKQSDKQYEASFTYKLIAKAMKNGYPEHSISNIFWKKQRPNPKKYPTNFTDREKNI